jgi:thiol-disulfide isomerase/thioredoxin
METCVRIFILIVFYCSLSHAALKYSSVVVELSYTNITRNLAEWEVDQAIVFYAPWCKYCKQLAPSWESIGTLCKSNQELIVGKFNCEAQTENRDLCKTLGIDRYPSILFIGYGNFNQAAKSPFAKSKLPQTVRYNADLYPEALYDWVLMLAFFSKMHRRWDNFKSLLTGKRSEDSRMKILQKRLVEAERKVEVFGKELEKIKANELFDSLEDKGDVFPILTQLEPDEVHKLYF